MKRALFVLALLINVPLFSQQNEIDSLGSLLTQKNVADTTKISALFRLTELLYLRNFDTIEPISKRAIAIIDKNLKKNPEKKLRIFLLKAKATGYNNLAVYFTNMAMGDTALVYYKKCLKIQLEVDDQEELPNTYNNLGFLIQKQGKIEEALKYYGKALKLAEKNNHHDQAGITCLNIGNLFSVQGDYEKSHEMLLRGLEHYKISKNKYGLSMANHNLAAYYESQEKDLKKALRHYEIALELKEEVGDMVGMAYTLNNIGHVYGAMKDNEMALRYFIEGYNLFSSQNHKDGLANSSGNVSKAYLQRGDYAKAIKYGEEALALARETGFPENIKNASLNLYNVYDGQKRYDKAIEMYRLYCDMRDSIKNDKTREATIEAQVQFKFDKKTLKDSLEHAKENEVNKAEIDKQDAELKARRNMQLFLYGGLALVLIFAIFMYNRFRVTQKQNRIIEEQKKEVELQKHIVEEKQKEIIDSINYAQRLQQAILAPKSDIDKYLPDNFLLYIPKDIVAGDFYFFETTPDFIFYAAADCTGHGVPGALMSVVCSNALSRCVKEFNLREPGKILDKARELILETLMKSGQEVKDGMDISLLAINRKTKEMKWAGAHNPLWYIENGEMKEIVADKQPIGKTDHPQPFTTHVLPLSISAVFLFTDGFADQFGGPKGKKLKYSNLQNFLLESRNARSGDIHNQLQTAFDVWKGDLEQVDDVCIIGIKI